MAQSQYATITDLQTVAITSAQAARYGTAAMDAQLQAASSIADSYLTSQFVLPLVVSPQGWDMSLTVYVCNIAAYLLGCQFGRNPNAPADELIEQRYNQAIGWLENVSKKMITPNFTDSSGSTTTSPAAGAFIISDLPVGFTSRGESRITGLPNADCTWPWGWGG